MEYILIAIAAYLIGSFPTGLLLTKLARGIDVRSVGSGKTGATNVMRTLGVRGFIVVFLVDFAKGLLPVLAAGQFAPAPWAQIVAGLATICGHNWSIYIGFSGGRGVATGIGGLYGVAPQAASVVTIVTVSVILLSRYVSLGSVVGAAAALPVVAVSVVLGAVAPEYLLYAVPGALLVIFRHRDNIERLLKGTERKMGERTLPVQEHVKEPSSIV